MTDSLARGTGTSLRGVLREQFGLEIVGACADGTEVLAAVAKLNLRDRAAAIISAYDHNLIDRDRTTG
jgi:hypothetical protein